MSNPTVDCLLVDIVDSVAAIDPILVLLAWVSNHANLVIVVYEIPKLFQIAIDLDIPRKALLQSAKHGEQFEANRYCKASKDSQLVDQKV